MLDELSKQDQKWRSIALKICGDRMLADDLVNDMYLKIDRIGCTSVNVSYVYFCIRSLFIDHIRKQKNTISADGLELQENEKYEINDNDYKVIQKFNNLKFYQQEIIEQHQNKSLRQIAKELNTCHVYVHREIKKAIKKIT